MYTENATAPCFFSRALDFAHTARGRVCGLAARSSWPSEIVGSEEESCSLLSLSRLTDRNWARRGKTERRSPPRSRSSRSLANEVGRNDHDDGGEVHDALIRDRQIQMDEKREKPKLIASARESVVGREGYFGAFLHSKYNLPRDYLLLPFPLGITAPSELCCSSQDLQTAVLEESAAVRSTHLSKLGRFVKSGGGAASASASGG